MHGGSLFSIRVTITPQTPPKVLIRYLIGGAYGVLVTVIEIGHGDMSSNAG